MMEKQENQSISDEMLARSLQMEENLVPAYEINLPKAVPADRLLEIVIDGVVELVQVPQEPTFYIERGETEQTMPSEPEANLDKEKIDFLNALPEELRAETLENDESLKTMYDKAKENEVDGFDDPLIDIE